MRCAGLTGFMRAAAFLGLVGFAATAGGCNSRGYYELRPGARTRDAILPSAPFPPRGLPMFSGESGELLVWTDLMEGVLWADIVLLGEMHDDAVAHEVQRAIAEGALSFDDRTVLSLEMLERDQQEALDDYLAGRLDAEAFLDAINVRSDQRREEWKAWYLPFIDEAKKRGTPVIAANAPRRLVRQARLEGYEALKALPPEEQALFDLPRGLDDGDYRRRFIDLMTSSRNDGAPADPTHVGLTQEQIEATFRAQLVWDATMADSIVRAMGGVGGLAAPHRVIHLVGQFHVNYNGGLVHEIAARAPLARVLVISLKPEKALALREDDRGAADAMVYTGWDGREDLLGEVSAVPADLRTSERTSPDAE